MIRIQPHILEILEQGRTDGNLFYLPDRQLERKTYLDVNKVLTALGGKWNRKFKAHIFESDISGAIDDVLLTGEVISKKQAFQFFETPPDVVEQLIDFAGILPGHTCLEPSAGRGNIAEALRNIAGESVFCIELMPENVQVLVSKGFPVHEGNFLQYDTEIRYDRIVMNPPFTRQQDITHVTKALALLKNDGVLVSVMSVGVTFRQDAKTKALWELVSKYNYETIELEQGAFKVSGTMVNTIILKVLK